MHSGEKTASWRYSEKKSLMSHTLHSPRGTLQTGDKSRRDPVPTAHGGKGGKDRCGGGIPHPQVTALLGAGQFLAANRFWLSLLPTLVFLKSLSLSVRKQGRGAEVLGARPLQNSVPPLWHGRLQEIEAANISSLPSAWLSSWGSLRNSRGISLF